MIAVNRWALHRGYVWGLGDDGGDTYGAYVPPGGGTDLTSDNPSPSVAGGAGTGGGSVTGSSILSPITAAITAAGNILGARYSVPQVAPGTMLKTANGTVIQTLPQGANYAFGSGFSSSLFGGIGGSILPLLLVGVVALIGIKAVSH